MKKFWTYAVYFVLVGVAFFGIVSWSSTDSVLRQITLSAAGGGIYLICFAIFAFISNGKRAWVFLAGKTLHRTTSIRLSISYLIRIRLGDKYVLIFSERFQQFQPVGGVYKHLSGAQQCFEDLGVVHDEKLPIDNETTGDLRVHVKGKHLHAFLNWFDRKENREYGPWREFYQELVEPGLLPVTSFRFVMFRWVRRHETRIQFSEHFQCTEYKIADIVEAELSDKQRKILEQKIDEHPGRLRAASAEDIRRYGSTDVSPKADIAETALWLIDAD